MTSSPPIENLDILEQELGALRLRCEVPPKKVNVFEMILVFAVGYILACMVGGMLLILPLEWLNAPLRVRQISVLSVVLLLDVYACWKIITHVSKDYLCLFEDGFAARVGGRRRQFRFDEIDQIGFGQLLTKLEKKLQGIGYLAYAVKPTLKNLHDEAARNMITVMLKSGKRVFVKGVLARFDKQQTRDFFRILLEEHPDLWEPPESS